MSNEIWKDIPDHPGYQASNIGRIRSIDRIVIRNGVRQHRIGVIRKFRVDQAGYYRVSLYMGKCKSAHRLVALAFLPNPDNKPQVNHINGIKLDNRVENLEWCTSGENIRHFFHSGVHKPRRRTNPITSRVLSDSQVREIIRSYDGKKNYRRYANKYGVRYNVIASLLRGESYRAILSVLES